MTVYILLWHDAFQGTGVVDISTSKETLKEIVHKLCKENPDAVGVFEITKRELLD